MLVPRQVRTQLLISVQVQYASNLSNVSRTLLEALTAVLIIPSCPGMLRCYTLEDEFSFSMLLGSTCLRVVEEVGRSGYSRCTVMLSLV